MLGADLLSQIRANSKGDRHSENFMKWVRKHRGEELEAVFLHWSNLDGSRVEHIPGITQPQQVLIGQGDDEGWFYGTRLDEILCSGTKANRFAFPPKFAMSSLPDWFDGYIKGGKCFVDPEHRWYPDRGRWQVAESGNSRLCLWCGEVTQHKKITKRVVTDTSWVSAESL